MKRPKFCLILAFPVLTDENAIYVQQSGDNANIDLEQVSGTSNIIGGSESEAGDLTALILSGSSMTLDINQIGASNIFRSDSITGDNFTGFFEFDGNSNQFDITMNSTGLISADFINANVDVERTPIEAYNPSDNGDFILRWVCLSILFGNRWQTLQNLP